MENGRQGKREKVTIESESQVKEEGVKKIEKKVKRWLTKSERHSK